MSKETTGPDDMIKATLARYGATLNCEGYITKGGDALGIKIVRKGRRLRYESATRLFASGPCTPEGVKDFVERFWYWKPLNIT